MLTQKRLKEVLTYDPETGIFRWLITRNNFVQKGHIAGAINNQGYVVIKIDGVSYQAHRLAWLFAKGKWPDGILDHIDHCEANNSIANLRDILFAENYKNRRRRSDNTSGIAGVQFHNGKWQARIVVKGKRISLGHFDRLSDAAAARCVAKVKFGYHPNHGN